MIDPVSNQPAPAAPAPQQHTTVITGDQPVAQVIFAAPADDGRWFRLLNSLIDSGAWGRLSDSACRTLVVLARHASADGTSLPAMATLMAQSGLSKSATYEALKELAAGDRPLIRKIPTGRAWELFPGRPFARRGRPGREAAERTPPPGRPFLSAGADPPDGGESAGADKQSAAAEKESATADVLLRRQTQDVVVDTFDDDDVDAELVRRLEQIGIRRGDVPDLVRRHGLRSVETAAANTEWKRDAREIRTTPRQYFFTALKSGFPLFAEVERKQQRETQAEEAARLLCRTVRPLLNEQQLALIERGLKSWRGAARAARFATAADVQRVIEKGEAPALAAWLIERAARTAGAGQTAGGGG